LNTNNQLPKRLKSFLPLRSIFIVIFTIIVSAIIYLSNNVFAKITQDYKDSVYEEINENILNKYALLLEEKINNSFLLANSTSKNQEIINFLRKNKSIDLETFLEDIQTKRDYVDIEIEIISKDGVSLAKSWSKRVGEKSFENNLQLQQFLHHPKTNSTLEATKFGLSIANKIPIFKKSELIGFLGMNIHLDAISDKFIDKGYKTVILLNKKDSSQIVQEVSYSKNFIDNIYVVNKNADSYIQKLIKQLDVNKYFLSSWKKQYKIDKNSGYLISKFPLKNYEGKILGDVFIFKNLDEIEFRNIVEIQQSHIATTSFIILFIAFVLHFIYSLTRIRLLDRENRSLIIINDELMNKTNEMDFNDKKMENLFNMQPNLMIMHNGKEITHANRRFMGFFNRFQTFDGFKLQHKCVSELFEKNTEPNYIYESVIEGKFWIDFILANPKRLYKIVIPYKDERTEKDHHFIIKLNEMEYAGKVDERLIIVALVDVTQDLKNA